MESEATHSHTATPIIMFQDNIESDNKSATSSNISQGEVMHIITSPAKKENLHLITILTLPDKVNNRVACKVLINQCCTDKGLISWELVKPLNLPTLVELQ